MKKLLVLLVVLGLLGAGGWFLYQRYLNPERQACSRFAELCGDAGKPRQKDEGRCERGLQEYRKLVGQQAYDKALRCVDQAQSCLGAAGCVAGGGLRGLGQFLEGVFSGLEVKDQGRRLLDQLKRSAGDAKLKDKGQELLERLKQKADEALDDAP